MPITTILFDLGKTFVDFDFDPLNEELGRRAGISADEAKLLVRGRYDEFCRGEMTGPEWHVVVQELLRVEIPYGEFTPMWADVFTAIDGMFDLASRTRPTCRHYLLSNTDPIHLAWCMERFPFDGLLDGMILSYEAASIKPDSRIFEYGFERFDVAPEESVFIDDLPANVESARALGVAGIVCESPEQVERELIALGVVTR